MKYNIGDITTNGWEVVDKQIKYIYKFRRKIKIISDIKIDGENLKNKILYLYLDAPFTFAETKKGRQFKIRESEYKFVKQKNVKRKNKNRTS